jgi:hypothetical protein
VNQSHGLSHERNCSYIPMILFVASACPSDCGWKAEDELSLTPARENSSNANAGGITLHYEWLGEDWELKHRHRRECGLEGVDHDVYFGPPSEGVFAEQSHEQGRYVVVTFN